MMPPGAALNPDTDSGEVSPGEDVPRDRLRLLLKEFAALDDAREPWRVLYPLHEVLLLVTCATIASCDDFDDIVAWGTHHLAVLRRLPARSSGRGRATQGRSGHDRCHGLSGGDRRQDRRSQGGLRAHPERKPAEPRSRGRGVLPHRPG